MVRSDYSRRAKSLALKILKVCDEMPKSIGGQTIARQLARSSTSVVANHRAAYRGRSKSEWLAKMGIVEEEADETLLWLEMAEEGGYCRADLTQPLASETGELLAITVAMIRTGRKTKESGKA